MLRFHLGVSRIFGHTVSIVLCSFDFFSNFRLKLPKNKWKLTDDSFSDYIVDLVSTFGF
jgi:hypothetical protein